MSAGSRRNRRDLAPRPQARREPHRGVLPGDTGRHYARQSLEPAAAACVLRALCTFVGVAALLLRRLGRQMAIVQRLAKSLARSKGRSTAAGIFRAPSKAALARPLPLHALDQRPRRFFGRPLYLSRLPRASWNRSHLS